VLLAVPSPALRAGLKSMLASESDVEVVGEGRSSEELLRGNSDADVLISAPASVVSMPVEPPGRADAPALLLLSDDPWPARELIRSAATAWGILPLEASRDELLAAVRALAQGLIAGAPALLFATAEGDPPGRGPLTERESEVLGLLARGLANKQIALALGISEHTVKFHVSSIYTKLNVTNRTEAVRAGLRGGWIAL
jgi:DNA-binding NarL/FixJ family response regulator